MTDEIFGTPWWLEAIAPGEWGRATVEDGGQMIAVWPYVARRMKFGLVRVGTTSLAPRMGPRFFIPDAKARPSRESEVFRQLVEGLPKYDYLNFALPSRLTNWTPFHWLGFQQTTRYSYVIDTARPLDEIWEGMADATRGAIRKATKNLEVAEGSAETLWNLTGSSFARQMRRSPYDPERLADAVAAARAHHSGTVKTAIDSSGQAHASALFVWDRERCYYLVGGADTALRSSGAMSLLLWDGIRLAHERGLIFDFEGSMIASVEQFFRRFGGTPEPYSLISHTSRLAAIGLAIRDLGHAIKGR
jgi:hypothetical protein